MTTKESPLKRAVKVAKKAMGPQRYQAHGNAIVCSICKHDRFKRGDYIVLLRMRTLVCAECGHVEFFKGMPELVEA